MRATREATRTVFRDPREAIPFGDGGIRRSTSAPDRSRTVRSPVGWLWILVGLFLGGSVAGCDHEKISEPPPDLVRMVDSLRSVVEGLRGESFRGPVEVKIVERDAMLAVYDSVAPEERDPADTAWTSLLWAFGFVDSVEGFSDAVDDVDHSSLQAFYSRGTLWIVKDVLDSSEELDVVVVHELVHALQDQRFDLEVLLAEAAGLDSRQAFQYLMEGEAKLVETMYAAGGMDSLEEFLPDQPLEAYRDTLRATGGLDPELVTLPTFHPYDQGAHVLLKRWREGGWEAVDAWWRRPPRSTRCFLDPRWSCPTPAALPLAPVVHLGADWHRAHRGRLGMLHTGILFSIWRDSEEWIEPGSLRSEDFLRRGRDLPPDSVVQGMVSDSFALMEDGEGSLALVWRTSWDDAAQAGRFLDAWSRLLVRKQRNDEVVAASPGTLMLARDAADGVWDRAERFGNEVWIAEGVPSRKRLVFEGGQRRPNGPASVR